MESVMSSVGASSSSSSSFPFDSVRHSYLVYMRPKWLEFLHVSEVAADQFTDRRMADFLDLFHGGDTKSKAYFYFARAFLARLLEFYGLPPLMIGKKPNPHWELFSSAYMKAMASEWWKNTENQSTDSDAKNGRVSLPIVGQRVEMNAQERLGIPDPVRKSIRKWLGFVSADSITQNQFTDEQMTGFLGLFWGPHMTARKQYDNARSFLTYYLKLFGLPPLRDRDHWPRFNELVKVIHASEWWEATKKKRDSKSYGENSDLNAVKRTKNDMEVVQQNHFSQFPYGPAFGF